MIARADAYPREMRRLLSAGLVALAATAALAAPTGAQRQPRKPVAAYCSPTGDICYGVINRGGAVYFELTTAARYFLRYRLCVRPPNGRVLCRAYPLRPTPPAGATWSSIVKFAGRYPHRGPGVYRATWRLGTRALGPTLRFRLPLSR